MSIHLQKTTETTANTVKNAVRTLEQLVSRLQKENINSESLFFKNQVSSIEAYKIALCSLRQLSHLLEKTLQTTAVVHSESNTTFSSLPLHSL